MRTEAILDSVVFVLFVTVMVRLNVHPVPTPSDEGTRVMDNAFHVQEPWLLNVTVCVFVPTRNDPTTLLKSSLLSVVRVALLIIVNLNVSDPPGVI